MMKFTKGRFKPQAIDPRIHSMMLPKFYFCFMVYDLFISHWFLLSFLKLKFWEELLDVYLILEEKL